MRAKVLHPVPGLRAGAIVNLGDANIYLDDRIVGTILDVTAVDDALEVTVDFHGIALDLPVAIRVGRPDGT